MASPRRYSPERVIFFLAIVLVVVLNFYLSEIAQNEVAATMPLLPEVVSSRLQQSPTVLKLPTPVFVVGFPKTGTSSIHEFFQCGGIKSSHYCCCGSSRTHTHCNDGGRTFGECMRDNIKSKLPILQGCGDYSVYAQMDAELGNSTSSRKKHCLSCYLDTHVLVSKSLFSYLLL